MKALKAGRPEHGACHFPCFDKWHLNQPPIAIVVTRKCGILINNINCSGEIAVALEKLRKLRPASEYISRPARQKYSMKSNQPSGHQNGLAREAAMNE